MENTNTIQFKDDQPEWYIAVGEKYRGPFRGIEVYEKLQAKEITWIDHVYREKDAKWIRLADHEVFQVLQPKAPVPKPVVAAPPPPPKTIQDETKWFLYQNDAQTGPYQTAELKRLIVAGQVSQGAFVWQEKFTEWKPFQEVEEFKNNMSQTASLKPSDKRAAPRKPLVAQVYLTNQKDLITGICRDISIGGMQVLTDQKVGNVGMSVRLNVTPPSDTGLKPFVAEGVVVRILEDGRGFSFRFTALDDSSRKSIESYIS